jgi:hypothetical protein
MFEDEHSRTPAARTNARFRTRVAARGDVGNLSDSDRAICVRDRRPSAGGSRRAHCGQRAGTLRAGTWPLSLRVAHATDAGDRTVRDFHHLNRSRRSAADSGRSSAAEPAPGNDRGGRRLRSRSRIAPILARTHMFKLGCPSFTKTRS